jgi:hypothetical protein
MTIAQLLELIARRPLLTKQDVAVRLRVSVRTVERWTKDSTLPRPVYIHGPRWPLNLIARFEDEHRNPPQRHD